MDNLGREISRMMWMLVGIGALAGAGITAAIIWVVRRLSGG